MSNRSSRPSREPPIEGIDELVEISSKVLELTENVDSLLQLITDRARQLLKCELSYISLVDETKRELYFKTSSGLMSEHFKKGGRVSIDAGISGWVFREREPAVCLDYANDPRRSQDHVPQVIGEGIKALVALPLIISSSPIGVLFISKRSRYHFLPEEVRLASAFANLASIGLQNSNFYIEQSKMSAKLEDLNKRLRRRNLETKRAHAIHQRFVMTELEGEGPKDIASMLSRLVNNPVVLEDRYGELLAGGTHKAKVLDKHSLKIDEMGVVMLAKVYPSVLHQLEMLTRKRRSLFVKFPNTDIGMRGQLLVTPIIARGEIMGYITVPELSQKLSTADVSATEYAAVVLALDLIKQRGIFEAEQRAKGDFLSQLLYGDYVSDEVELRRASYLGYDLVGPRRVMVMSCDGPVLVQATVSLHNHVTSDNLDRILRRVNEAISNISPKSTTAVMNENIIIIADSGEADDKFSYDGIEGQIAEATRRAAKQVSSESAVSIGIGCICHELKDYKRSFHEAMKALDIAKWLDKSDQIIPVEALGIYGILFDLDNHQRLSQFCRETLDPLITYDRKHSAPLLKTLSTYFKCKRSLELSSRLLFVHPNTVRQRLERAAKLLNRIDFNDGDDQLILQLALKTWEAEQHVPAKN